jgi:hypothetical protein
VDGESGKRNFQVYVRKKYESGEIPMQDEYDRLRKDFKATIPEDVMNSFAKLYDIAIKNKVDFLDLCVYALGEK